MEKQWLSINPGTFIWVKENIGLVYDSETFNSFRFNLSARILEICNELLCPDNLNTTIITKKDYADKVTLKWLNAFVDTHKLGKLTNINDKKPISLKPIFKLLNDADFYKYEHNEGIGGSILKNIHELFFYLNSSYSGNDKYFRQLPFPIKSERSLRIDDIVQFARYSQNPFLSNISLIGNLFLLADYRILIEQISELVKHVTINITYTDFFSHIEEVLIQTWPQNITFSILYDSIPSELLELKKINLSVSTIFLVDSEKDFEQISDMINNIPIYCDAQFIPVFNGDNISFFEDNIYTKQKDLDEIKLIKREIFIHQALNSNDFGKLTILSDGLVYANVNFEPLGNISNSPYSIVFKEITEGRSWLRIRDMKPCCDCVYQWLCPSPSDYEIVIGRPNLCKIIQ